MPQAYRRGSRARKQDARRKSTSRRKSGRRRKTGPAGQAKSPSGFDVQLPVDREEMVELMQEALHSFAVEVGLMLAGKLLDDEVERLCGPRYEREAARRFNRHGRQAGFITLSGQKLHINKPRVRSTDGREADLESYRLMQREDAMPSASLARMVRGVSTRDYEGVVDVASEGFGIQRSSVSRGFVKASARLVKELSERRFEGVRFAAILIDGVEFAGETMICALGITEDGTKQILGHRQGATENAQVVTELLENLVERGLDASRPVLFVLDGAKALHSAVKRVFGRMAIIQRCQVHKKRNVKAHLAEEDWPELLRRMNEAYHGTDYEKALGLLKRAAAWLERKSPDAAASLREGMEETLTVIRLGIPDLLRQTLATTNPIESAFHTARRVTGRVKRWRGGDMRQRWSAAGLMRAEETFRRVRGYKQIPRLIAALDTLVLDGKRKAG